MKKVKKQLCEAMGGKMNYITVKEAAKKWGYSEQTIRKWCREDKVYVTFTAEKKNGQWQIPSEAECLKKKATLRENRK